MRRADPRGGETKPKRARWQRKTRTEDFGPRHFKGGRTISEANTKLEVEIVVLSGQDVDAKLNLALGGVCWDRVGHKLEGLASYALKT